jgi:hypothetical protein
MLRAKPTGRVEAIGMGGRTRPLAVTLPPELALVLLGIAAPNPARAEFGKNRAQLLLEPWSVQEALRVRLTIPIGHLYFCEVFHLGKPLLNDDPHSKPITKAIGFV